MPDSQIAPFASESGASESDFAGQAPESAETGVTNAFWRRIERMLADIAALARSEPLPPDFHASVLASLNVLLPTPGGIFWIQDRDGRLWQKASYFPGNPPGAAQARQQDNGTENCTGNCITACDETIHLGLVRAALDEGTARAVPLEFRHDPAPLHSVSGRSQGTLLLCPIRLEADCAAVLEVIHDDRSGVDEQLSLDVLRSVGELCADYLRRSQLHELARERTVRERFALFTRRVHDNLDLAATAYTIANEGRQLIECDRVTVLACRGPDCQTLAVSGAATWDRRSNTIAGLERLAAVVAGSGEPLHYREGQTGLPPQVRVPLEAYLEHAQVRELIVAPLVRRTDNDLPTSRPPGMLIVEQFSGILTESAQRTATEVCEACTPALAHALEFQRIPWARLFRQHDWRSWLRRGRAAGIVVAVLFTLLLAACVIPADFQIEARGVMEPQNRRDVFAPSDGIVDDLRVNHGTSVAGGKALIVLRNPQLDLDLKRVWGELQTARKRLAAIETARIEGTPASAATPISAARLSGEDAELQEQVASLTRQHQLLQEHQDELSVSSPIAGQVLTWDLPQLLQGRPVHRGQVLMTIADPQGPWQLELEIPDRDAGFVLETRDNSGPAGIPVTYLIATDPGTQHAATIDKIALSIERTYAGEPALRAVVRIEPGTLSNFRPGSTVIAKINCGRRSLAYVWLHDLYYAVKTRLLF